MTGARAQLHNAPERELLEGMEQLYGLHIAAHAHLLRFIAEYDSRGENGNRDTVVAVSTQLGVPIAAATRWVEVARALDGLPHIASAFEAGSISFDKVVALTRIATTETDAALAEAAPSMTTAQLRQLARKIATADELDPNAAHKARYFSYRWNFDHTMVRLSGELPGDMGDVVVNAIEREMDSLPADSEGEFAGYEQKAADALVNLASARIADDQDPDRATMVVHTDLSVLQSDEGLAETGAGTPLHPDTARRLACDARIQVVLHDREGRTLGVGRTMRTPPPWLRRQVQHRDGGCRFPECNHTRFLRTHHIEHWGHEGPTDLDNLVMLCPQHHRLVHEKKWSMELDPGGEVRWMRPDGAPYANGPPPLSDDIRKRFFGPLLEPV